MAITIHKDQQGYAFYWDDNWALPPAIRPAGRLVNNVLVPTVFDTENIPPLWNASLPHPGMSSQDFIHLWVVGHPNGGMVTARSQSQQRPFLWDSTYEGPAPLEVPPGRGVDPYGYMMSNEVPDLQAEPTPPPFAPPPVKHYGRGFVKTYEPARSVPKPTISPYLGSYFGPPSAPPADPIVYPPPGGGPFVLPPQPPPPPPVQPPVQPPIDPNSPIGPNKPVLTPHQTTPLPTPLPKPNPMPALTTPVLVPSPTGDGTFMPGFGDFSVEPTSVATKWSGAGLLAGLTSPFWLPLLLLKRRRR